MATKVCGAIQAENFGWGPSDQGVDVSGMLVAPEFTLDAEGNISGTINDAQGKPILWYWTKDAAPEVQAFPLVVSNEWAVTPQMWKESAGQGFIHVHPALGAKAACAAGLAVRDHGAPLAARRAGCASGLTGNLGTLTASGAMFRRGAFSSCSSATSMARASS